MRLARHHIVFSVAILCGFAITQSSEAAVVSLDLTTANTTEKNTSTLNGNELDFIFSTVSVGSSGTGLIDSFVRIQDGPNEQGYNSDLAGNAVEFDEKSGTRSLLISELQTGYKLNEAGNNDLFAEIVLDSNDGGLLSLNQIQIFAATADYATSSTLQSTNGALDDTTDNYPIITFDPMETVEIFRLSTDLEAFTVQINSALGSGSGTFDLRFLFDLDILSSLGPEYTHLIVYSNFGQPPGPNASDGGFEEWAIATGQKSAFIPEPSTWAMLLISACGAVFCQYRQQRKLKLAAAQAGDC